MDQIIEKYTDLLVEEACFGDPKYLNIQAMKSDIKVRLRIIATKIPLNKMLIITGKLEPEWNHQIYEYNINGYDMLFCKCLNEIVNVLWFNNTPNILYYLCSKIKSIVHDMIKEVFSENKSQKEALHKELLLYPHFPEF